MKAKRSAAYISAGKEKVSKNANYAMRMSDLETFVEMANDQGVCAALGAAYYMGVEAGSRMTEKGRC